MKPNPYESTVANEPAAGKSSSASVRLFFASVAVYALAAILLFAVDAFRFEYGSSVTDCAIQTQGCFLAAILGFLGAAVFGASGVWGLAASKSWGKVALLAIIYTIFVFAAYSQVSSSFSSGMLTL